MNLAGPKLCRQPREHSASAGILYVPGGTFPMRSLIARLVIWTRHRQ